MAHYRKATSFCHFRIHMFSEIVSPIATPVFILNIWTAFPELTTPLPHFYFTNSGKPICFT